MTVELSEDEWRAKLTPSQYQILRKKGTEPPFSGKLLHNNLSGDYTCAACGAVVFKSDYKFDSTTPGLEGWPSFSEIADSGSVKLQDDDSMGMHRVEAVCSNCGGHLGHLFEDNSSPTGQHYCINSEAIDFKPKP